ncbi:MAG: WYL domain-containing protein [Eubacteriales bacterium]|nr:WYL domain-containing protein [Eubacteriales bacterium]
MRILMLGNSYTFYNDLPGKLAALTGAEVVQHTRGGARLSEQLNPKTEMGARTLEALKNETWDYVVLQEMSNGPVTSREAFLRSAARLCEKIRAAKATPVLFATWPYERDSAAMAKMEKKGIGYDVMAAGLSAAYHEAAERNDALIADVGQAFYKTASNAASNAVFPRNVSSGSSAATGSASRNNNNTAATGSAPRYNNTAAAASASFLYSEDGSHPSEEGTRLAAAILADVILEDQKKKKKTHTVPSMAAKASNDQRLRILYLYRILLRHSDPEHPLSTNQIREFMETEHGITMHRTTVPSDVALLQAAGIPVCARRSNVMLYYLEETRFELPELKILIDAVESSKFITESKCRRLIEKLTSLTSEKNAEKLKRNLYTSGRVRSGNEKGYYIVDAINEAINEQRQISFLYTEYNEKKQLVLRNDGSPYIVSPYILIWNGDYYYLVGYYHAKKRITTFRVDRILTQPEVLPVRADPVPKDFDILRYTREIFRMYDNQEQVQVTLLCENSVMKGVIDQFGPDISVKQEDDNHFSTKVTVCTSQTFYAWVFQWRGAIRILAPGEVREEYREMARLVLEET